MAIDENKLIKGCVRGDRKAQEQLYRQFSSSMFAICLRYTKAQQEAEDVLQESFIKVFKQIKNYKGDAPLVFWIKRIVINTALNSQRGKLYLYPMVDVDDLKESQGQQQEVSDYTMNELMAMVQALPGSSQVIFNLYAIEGYKHQEIAEMLGVSVGTSKSQYSRAKYLLRERMKENKKNYGKG
ncbi:RNA polymerase sigma-70 factor, ECF subfamily [Reichenbachiella faecimaris]|uniref:RNA polymerase sigma-70 factor, ECF subfamily n=1 Tax=Reichenbachiella faecimaris TaxID=692418 RepID=A0A1W2G6Q9_REIFA|nr:RNA polymerase sigma factor [Reichenbachiella faecimaris]SMD32357.1 RNA polymerase sigma-70 factor, ECF subfamily [Reichenbachiella faecimaris]